MVGRLTLVAGILVGANLSNTNLVGANLSGADLNGADLSQKNLTKTNLANAKLQGVVFSDADLSEVDFRGALFDQESVLEGKETIASFKIAKGVDTERFCIESYPAAGNISVCQLMPQELINAISCPAADVAEAGPTCGF